MNLFVYGSLKQGKQANHYLEGQKFKGNYTTKAVLRKISWFPAIFDGDGVVHGEVYEIDPKLLNALDRYEGYPSLYTRKTIEVVSDTGQTEMAIAYFGNMGEDYPLVETGVW